jgi:uncharacterized protein (DUF2252 family)
MWYHRCTTSCRSQGVDMSSQGPVSQGDPDVVHAVAQEAAAARTVDHFTVAERAARGKATRAEVPRSSHGVWEAPPNRVDPVVLLEAQARTRVPELVPVRHGRMLVSPFTFYRGAAALMAADLEAGPRTGLTVQLCGDAHLSNFGIYATPDRRLTFAVNDFDETLPGPFEWDVKRLVASFEVAGRDRGFDSGTRGRVNRAVVRSYREAMRQFATMNNLELWYARLDVDQLVARYEALLTATGRKRLQRTVAKARTKDSLRAFSKLTTSVDGEPRIAGDPPLIVPIAEMVDSAQAGVLYEAMRSVIRAYRHTLQGDRRRLLERYRFVDAARKVVGVGSVGTRAWIVLMLGRDDNDPLFLQAKEAEASVLEPYLGKSPFANHGQRVVEGQRLMQAASDILLGWVHTPGLDRSTRDFYVRQLWDSKGSADVEVMQPPGLEAYGRLCGWTLAKAHARSGDPIAIGAYLGAGTAFDEAMAGFADCYATQNERDYAALREAVASGRITAVEGV